LQRLAKAGFKREFIQAAVLPDWWDEGCEDDPSVLQDLEIRAARFLGHPVAIVADPTAPLAAPAYPAAQLRRVRDVSRDRLAPAIHAAMSVARAVVRNLRGSVTRPDASPLPGDGLQWRQQLVTSLASPRLEQIVGDLWRRGIPVVPLAIAPAPGFQAMACIAEGRPVVLIGYKNDEPGRVAFLVAHEAGHIAADDCAPDQPVVDEEDEIPDTDSVEVSADRYATRVLVGQDEIPIVDDIARHDFKELARQASRLEQTSAADASSVIFSWARRTGDYATASMAVKALYRSTGARVVLSRALNQGVDFSSATETDRSLLHLCGLVGASNEVTR
jgi:hypothetical protein